MKRVFFALGFLMACSYVHAGGIDEGISGSFGGSKVWKSTEIARNDTRVVIATGDIVIGYVQVLSTGTNSTIAFQQFGSTVAGFGMEWRNYYASAPVSGIPFDTNNSYMSPGIYVMERSTIGWCYTTAGYLPAKLRIFWDYVTYPR